MFAGIILVQLSVKTRAIVLIYKTEEPGCSSLDSNSLEDIVWWQTKIPTPKV